MLIHNSSQTEVCITLWQCELNVDDLLLIWTVIGMPLMWDVTELGVGKVGF